MDYLGFDLLAVALPAALLLRGADGRRLLLAPVLALVALAVAWTAPWDEHLVRSGVWTYPPDRVLARVGAVPVEEYAFVALEVLLVGAWALRLGVLGRSTDAQQPAARHRGALAWCGVGVLGLAMVLLGGHLRYAGLLLVWAAPPLALQRGVAGDVLAARRPARLAAGLPVAIWLCAADRFALADGIWTVAPGSSTGLDVLGLPVEEAAFFLLTCLLVTDGLLLATDPAVLRRAGGAVRRAAARHRQPRPTPA